MKKITIIIPTLFMGLAMFGQTGVIKKNTATKELKPFKTAPQMYTSKAEAGLGNMDKVQSSVIKGKTATATPFWSDDFSNAANWDVTDAINSDVWVIGTTPPPVTGYQIPVIGSTTAANGFALFNSDGYCSGNQDANLTLVNAIDCSTHPNVILTFQENYRRFYDSVYVEVTTDNISWDQYGYNVDLNNGDYSSGSRLDSVTSQSIDITASAGGKTGVIIRFRYYSPSSLGAGAGCAYNLYIDDVALIDQPANDLAISAAIEGAKTMVDCSGGNNGFYTMQPKAQAGGGFWFFHCFADNLGSNDQTNAIVTVDLNDGTGSVFTASSTPQTLVKGSKDSLMFPFDGTPATAYIPAAVPTTYTATYTLSQDQAENAGELANNTATRTFAVTDTTFAHDDGIQDARQSPNWFTGNETDGIAGTKYFMSVEDEASSISFKIDSRTSNNSIVQAELYEVDSNDATGATATLIASSALHTIDSITDGGSWMTLSIKTPGTPVILNDMMEYYVAVHCTGVDANNSTQVFLGIDKTTWQPNASAGWINVSGAWAGWVSYNYQIRLNTTSLGLGVNNIAKNNGVNVSQNMPNPTKGISTINYELDKNAAVTLAVYDVTGKKVASQNEGSQLAGKHAIRFNAENLSEGVYYYSLTVNGTATSTMKMVVIK